MTWAEDKALRGRNLSADPGVANESGRLPMPPDSFPLICNINAKNPKVNTLSVSLIQRTGFHFRLNQNTLVVVTTLLDAEQYPAAEIALLYRRRWQAELHLRSIKVILQMDHLRCRTPAHVRNEFFMHLVGYNLIREVMAEAAQLTGKAPWEISFKGTLQTLSQFLAVLLTNVPSEVWCKTLLTAIAAHVVGHRPGRFEPRRVKRRAKPYKLLQKHRHLYTTRDEKSS